MTGFLAELGKKLAERWVAMLVLPGALFTAVAVLAVLTGHRRWYDTDEAWQRLNAVTTGGAVVAVATFLLASAGAGMLAGALSRPAENVLAGRWPWPFRGAAKALARRRGKRWTALDQAENHTARNRLALAPPEYPTWLGDRLNAPFVRVSREYGLDVTSSWSRLWLLLPDSTRTPLTEARERLDAATTVGGWAVLYFLLGAVWWPSAVIGAALGVIAWRRARVAGEVYADLLEAAYDVHLGELLARFDETEVSSQRGKRLTERFRKGV